MVVSHKCCDSHFLAIETTADTGNKNNLYLWLNQEREQNSQLPDSVISDDKLCLKNRSEWLWNIDEGGKDSPNYKFHLSILLSKS